MSFRELVAAELSEAVAPRVSAMAAAIAAQHAPASRAVLFYGSCLREQQLDGLMLDFYLIVSDYETAFDKAWLATANRLIPPNVFPFAHDGLASKYAVLSEADFYRLNGTEASSVSVWARFSQPSRLVWHADQPAKDFAVDAVARAAPTLFHFAQPISSKTDSLSIWEAGFAETYKAEIRAERTGRSHSIIESDPLRYTRFGDSIRTDSPLTEAAARRSWRRLQRNGKLLTVLRLAKASLTFAGGIDYLAWKINRHAGTKLEIKPWQRRRPIIAAFLLVPRLLLRGAIK